MHILGIFGKRFFIFHDVLLEIKQEVIIMPSNSILEQKKAVVAELVEKIKKAQSGVLVQYQGITVENDTKMRAAFRKAGIDYMVIKNTLIGRACDEVGYGAIKDQLNGMSAIAISYNDPIAPAKIAKEYADKVETFEIKGGFLDNAVVDAATVNALAEIPSKEILLARFLGSIQGPISGFARAIQAVIDKDGEAAAE
jgi:large subunit ribosomal protein L10